MGLATYKHIRESTTINLKRLYVVGHEALMEDEALCAALSTQIDSFEAITRTMHSNRVTEARNQSRSSIDW